MIEFDPWSFGRRCWFNSPNQLPASATVTTTAPSGTAWTAGTAYAVGAVVNYNGARYRCLQAHTSLAGWEPPNVPALWATA